MSNDTIFDSDAFLPATVTNKHHCSGCDRPVPSFIAKAATGRPESIPVPAGTLTIKDGAQRSTYKYYNSCRHQLRELVDLHGSSTGCPACGSTERSLSVRVSINTGPHPDDVKAFSDRICEKCANSLYTRAHTASQPPDEFEYCIPEWLTAPPWNRTPLTVDTDSLDPTSLAPQPPTGESSSIGATEAQSFETRKAFHELIKDCLVTVGVYQPPRGPRPAQYLTVRGIVERVDRNDQTAHELTLSVGDAIGWLLPAGKDLPDRVRLRGWLRTERGYRGEEKYQKVTAHVETWQTPVRGSWYFESVLSGFVTGLTYRSPQMYDYKVSPEAPMGEYPPEPSPPATVTELSTIFLDDGRLSADLKPEEKQWVAVLTGTSRRYRFTREWVAVTKPRRDSNIVTGTTDVEEGTFIEVGWDSTAQFLPPEDIYESIEEDPYRIRRYFQVQDSELVECTRDAVEEQLE